MAIVEISKTFAHTLVFKGEFNWAIERWNKYISGNVDSFCSTLI